MRRVEHTPLLGASAEAHSEMVVDLNEALRPTNKYGIRDKSTEERLDSNTKRTTKHVDPQP